MDALDSSSTSASPPGARRGALDRLAEALSRAERVTEMAEVVAEEIRAAFDAALVLVSLADERRGGLLSVASSGIRNRDVGAEPLLPFATPTLMTDAFRSDRAIVVDRDEYVARYPHMADTIPDSRIEMAVGRRFAGPNAAGAISMCFAARRPFTSADQVDLDRLLSVLPDAFARARSADREREISLTLQAALLPADRLVGFDGWQRAVRYRPASDEASIGGDWFDLHEIGPDRLAVAVGDIVGKGVHAAAVMGQMRSALRALARVVEHPADALDELDRFSQDVEGAFASTALLAVIDTERRLVRIATAGHVPPMVATPDGVIVLDGARGLPMGLATPGPRRETELVLDEEQTILFYIDGLVERRGETIDEGLDRLARTLDEHRDEPLQRLVDLAIDDAASGSDDIAVVALRPVGARPRTFSASIRSHPEQLRSVRGELRRWLVATGAGEVLAADLLVAVNEALTNARDHAYQGADDGEIVVNGRTNDGRIELSVRDRGRWAPSVRSPARGRGLSIIGAVTDDHQLEVTPEGIEVRMAAAIDRAGGRRVGPA
jgi:anti-sigma regulatory factor (Ser/Thr protein kinase)